MTVLGHHRRTKGDEMRRVQWNFKVAAFNVAGFWPLMRKIMSTSQD